MMPRHSPEPSGEGSARLAGWGRHYLAEETLGWKQAAPYDAIIVTAGAPRVPDELLDQLAVGGRMVIPVGSRYVQELCQITKRGDRNMLRKMGGCRFVSLIGKSAWEN